jgi:WD40 repeat protein
MKNKLFFFFAFLLAFAGLAQANANDIDTVWMRWMPHGHDVSSVRFSPDDSKIAAFSEQNNAVSIVDVPTGNIDTLLSGFKWGEYSQDGNYIYAPKGKLIYQINTQDYSYSSPFDTAVGGLASISISDNGLAVCKTGNGFQVWDLETGDIIYNKFYKGIDHETKTGQYFINTKITKDNNYILSAVYDIWEDFKGGQHIIKAYIELIDPLNFEIVKIIDNANDIFLSNTSKFIALDYYKIDDTEDIAVNIYDLELSEIIFSISGNKSLISDIAFSPDDKYMAVAYESKKGIEIWDLENIELVYNYLRNPLGSYLSISKSTNNQYIVAGTNARLYLYKSYWSMVTVPDNEIQATITYPNPTHDIFNLEFELIQDNMTTIDMIDLTGQVVKIIDDNFLLSGHQFYQVDITNLPAGMYTLRILSGNYSFNSSIIKN